MGVEGDYLGMPLRVEALDQENLAYFRHCAAHEFRLQRCVACGLLRYPPTTGCPWCGHPDAVWTPVEGKGAVYTYAEVHHAIQPAFKGHLPYLILIVELDTQNGVPTEHDALRIAGNLVTLDGDLAPPDLGAKVGIGTRVRWSSRTSPPASRSRSGPSTRPPSRRLPGATRRARDHPSLRKSIAHPHYLW